MREVLLKRDYPEGLPYYYVQDMMLCSQHKDFIKYGGVDAEIWKDGGPWILQEKLDGVRIMLHITGGKVYSYSRNVSVKTYRHEEYDSILSGVEFPKDIDCLLDCEAISDRVEINTSVLGRKHGTVTVTRLQATTATLALDTEASIFLQKTQAPIRVYPFDVVYLNGAWIGSKPLHIRLEILESLLPKLTEVTDLIVPLSYVSSGKREFYEKILLAGGEGVVAKHLYSTYVATSSRAHRSWVKIKRMKEIDAFVVGFTPGDPEKGWGNMVGGLIMGVYLTKNGQRISDTPHEIAAVTNLGDELRKIVTVYNEKGEVILNPEYLGKVAEVRGQDISARKRSLVHSVITRWRYGADGKSPEDCTMEESELDSLVL